MALDILWGLVAGFVAALVMAILLLPTMRMGPSVITMVAARTMGGDLAGRRNVMRGMVLHLIYGTIMGGAFAAGSTYIITFVNPLVNGVLFGILLFVVMVAVVMPFARAPRFQIVMAGIMFIIHLAYGAVLGTMAGWLSGQPII